MTEAARRLLLVGAGPAHLAVLQSFARQPAPAGSELLLVHPSPTAVWPGMVPGVVAGRFAADEALRVLAPVAAQAGIRLVEGRAVALDAAARRLTLADGRELGYGLLSLDVGGRLDREAVAGAPQHALALRPLESFMALQAALAGLAAARAVDLLVIGSGGEAVQLALALASRAMPTAEPRAGSHTGAASIGTDRARVALACGAGGLLGGYPPNVVARVRRALALRRVTVFPEAVLALDGRQARLASGARLACDGAVLATGSQPWPWLAESGLALADDGFVAIGATLQSRSHPEVFAVGDCATRDDVPGAMAGERSGAEALQAGPALAANLRRMLAGEPPRPWTPRRPPPAWLATGDGGAIAGWGGFSFEGRLPGWWLERRERASLARWAQAGEASASKTGGGAPEWDAGSEPGSGAAPEAGAAHRGDERPGGSSSGSPTGNPASSPAAAQASELAGLSRPAGS